MLAIVGIASYLVISGSNKRVLAYEQHIDIYENLLTALQGEVTATEKYVQFAAVAEREGNTAIQRLFLAAAAAEQIHIDKEYEIANAMKPCELPVPGEFALGSSQENLQSCVDGELYESQTMYPAFFETATQNNYPLAAKTFRYARDAEASHAVMFAEELELLKADGMSTGSDTYYICPVCGRLEKGSAGLVCQVCGTPGFLFETF